eukprot:TRINITY_DN11528_c0_g1_i2.p1 TRINITY_DN11528_c0_g1~~TRINITY_DN11528_c0_g1_i2.p1  ORF type:complete len:382 (+),score=84.80 TRINITY_DN11528_c0_g1_i2:113-1258(+)
MVRGYTDRDRRRRSRSYDDGYGRDDGEHRAFSRSRSRDRRRRRGRSRSRDRDRRRDAGFDGDDSMSSSSEAAVVIPLGMGDTGEQVGDFCVEFGVNEETEDMLRRTDPVITARVMQHFRNGRASKQRRSGQSIDSLIQSNLKAQSAASMDPRLHKAVNDYIKINCLDDLADSALRMQKQQVLEQVLRWGLPPPESDSQRLYRSSWASKVTMTMIKHARMGLPPPLRTPPPDERSRSPSPARRLDEPKGPPAAPAAAPSAPAASAPVPQRPRPVSAAAGAVPMQRPTKGAPPAKAGPAGVKGAVPRPPGKKPGHKAAPPPAYEEPAPESDPLPPRGRGRPLKRKDPTDPTAGEFTRAEFEDFHGAAEGARLWEEAGVYEDSV